MTTGIDDNPYRAPQTLDAVVGRGSRKERDQILLDLGRVVVAWEKMRVVYNIVGAVPASLLGLLPQVSLVQVLLYALFANLCFCLGPLFDG